MEKDIKFEKDGISYILSIRRYIDKLHQITVWQSLDNSADPKFKSVGFFSGEPYGKVGTDVDRTTWLKGDRSNHPNPSDPYWTEIIEHNEKLKIPARKRVYSLIHEQCPWLSNVVYYERGEGIEFHLERSYNEHCLDKIFEISN